MANTFTSAQVMNAGLTLGTVQNALVFGHANAYVVPGSTTLNFRNTANSATNIAITDAGGVTIRAGLTVTASGITVTAGGLTVSADGLTVASGTSALQAITGTGLTVSGTTALTFGAAAAKIIPGATSLTVRDSGDTVDLFKVEPTLGHVTVGHVSSTSGLRVLALSGFDAQIGWGGGGISLTPANNAFVYLGAASGTLNTSATAQLPVIPHCAGTPNGSLSRTGAVFWDNTNKKLYIHNGTSWFGSAAFI